MSSRSSIPPAEAFGFWIDQIDDRGLLVLDRDRRVAWSNATAEGLTGYDAAEALGRPWDELVGPLVEGTVVGPLLRKDGSTLLVETRTSATADGYAVMVRGLDDATD